MQYLLAQSQQKQAEADRRARVLTAGIASGQSMPASLLDGAGAEQKEKFNRGSYEKDYQQRQGIRVGTPHEVEDRMAVARRNELLREREQLKDKPVGHISYRGPGGESYEGPGPGVQQTPQQAQQYADVMGSGQQRMNRIRQQEHVASMLSGIGGSEYLFQSPYGGRTQAGETPQGSLDMLRQRGYAAQPGESETQRQGRRDQSNYLSAQQTFYNSGAGTPEQRAAAAASLEGGRTDQPAMPANVSGAISPEQSADIERRLQEIGVVPNLGEGAPPGVDPNAVKRAMQLSGGGDASAQQWLRDYRIQGGAGGGTYWGDPNEPIPVNIAGTPTTLNSATAGMELPAAVAETTRREGILHRGRMTPQEAARLDMMRAAQRNGQPGAAVGNGVAGMSDAAVAARRPEVEKLLLEANRGLGANVPPEPQPQGQPTLGGQMTPEMRLRFMQLEDQMKTSGLQRRVMERNEGVGGGLTKEGAVAAAGGAAATIPWPDLSGPGMSTMGMGGWAGYPASRQYDSVKRFADSVRQTLASADPLARQKLAVELQTQFAQRGLLDEMRNAENPNLLTSAWRGADWQRYAPQIASELKQVLAEITAAAGGKE